MRKLLIIAALCCAAAAQMQRFDSQATATTGQPGSIQLQAVVPGSTVYVCTGSTAPCNSPGTASLFSDIAGTVSLAQPVTADANGRFGWYWAAGTYVITITPPVGSIGTVQSYVVTAGPTTAPEFSVTTPTPYAPSPVTATVVGTPGSTTYYYWVVSNFTIGNSAPSAAAVVKTAAATLSQYNYDQISWAAVTGANTYDVLRTTSATAPTGACACAVATAVNALTANDQSNSLSAYTVNTYAGNTTFNITNVAAGAGESKLTFAADHGTQFTVDNINGASFGSLSSSHPSVTPNSIETVLYADQFSGTSYAEKVEAAWADAQCSAGCTVMLPAGTLAWDAKLSFPSAIPERLLGQGVGITVLKQSADASVLGGPASGAADGDIVGGFSVQAPAAGTTATAIDLSGFRASTFQDIGYLSNGTGNFGSFFHLSASPALCYGNLILRPYVAAQTGPATVFLFDNGGTSNPSNNANANTITGAWVYANNGITTVIDARRSAMTSIRDSLFESNSGATVLIPGSLTDFSGSWLESNASTSISGATGSDGGSNGDTIRANYFSGAQTVAMASGNTGWTLIDNSPCSTLTFTGVASDNSAMYCGATQVANQTDPIFQWQNAASGGGQWGLYLSGTGGLRAAGSVALVDAADSDFAHLSMLHQGGNYMAAGASASPALALNPRDDLNTSTCVLQITNAAASVTKACVDKSGNANFAGATQWGGGATIASSSGVALLGGATFTGPVNAPTLEQSSQAIVLAGTNGLSAGTITLAAGAGSHTFSTAYSAAPICVAADTTAAAAVHVTSSTTAVTVAGTGTDVIAWQCSPAVN